MSGPTLRVEDVAQLDHDRRRRTGIPEVVLGEGKTPEQTLRLLAELRRGDPSAPALATRCSEEVLASAGAAFPDETVTVDALGRTVTVGELPSPTGRTAVVTAGTTDLPVAHECRATLLAFGVDVDLVPDVGVAGLHRLLGHLDRLGDGRRRRGRRRHGGRAARASSAGWSALPMSPCPPASATARRSAASPPLLGMLNSCAPASSSSTSTTASAPAVFAARVVRARSD